MTWQKGVSGNSNGRPKGTSNVNKYRVLEVFHDFNPLENLKNEALRAKGILEKSIAEAAKALREGNTNHANNINVIADENREIYIRCNEILAPYFAPKFKAVELTAEDTSPLAFYMNIAREGAVSGTAIDNIQRDEDSK